MKASNILAGIFQFFIRVYSQIGNIWEYLNTPLIVGYTPLEILVSGGVAVISIIVLFKVLKIFI